MASNNSLPYSIGTVTLKDGIEVFYRESGDVSKPTVLLLHGFPSSSHQFRNLIPLLAREYHVLAPDYPGFGFTVVPDSLNYTYTFDNLAATVSAFLDAKHVTTFTPYLFDFGAPVGFRLLLQRPSSARAIITQNGNAYTAGFGQEFWAPVFALWNATTPEETSTAQAALGGFLTLDATKSQYTVGSPDPGLIAPESYWLDYTLLQRPGNAAVQLSLFTDYKTNVAMYPSWQAWLREHRPKTLAVWGRNDIAFIPAGAEAFKADVPDLELHLLDAGHFALETNLKDVADYILDFLRRVL